MEVVIEVSKTHVVTDHYKPELLSAPSQKLSLEDITPIPLTEEMLLKCGFEKWETIIINQHEYHERFVLHNAIHGTSNFEVRLVDSCYGGQQVDSIEFYCDYSEHISYHNTDHVHNMQNCFNGITGEELTIEL